jgi:UDP-glucose 4-epimerase
MPDIRKVVVLGHTGFVGKALFEHFQESGGIDVYGFSSQTLDLRDSSQFGALKDVSDSSTALIYTSAITPDKGNDLSSLRANVDMAENVSAFLGDHNIGMVVFFSTDALYPMMDSPLSEDTPIEPTQNFYAASKYTCECILELSARSNDIPLLILRPTGVYGPGDTHGSYGPNRFSRTIAAENSVSIFGQGEETRDHIFVDDLVKITATLLERKTQGVFNLATGASLSFGEIVEALEKIAPRPFEVINRERAGEITHRAFDISHLKGELGDFPYVDLGDGLRATFEYFSENHG